MQKKKNGREKKGRKDVMRFRQRQMFDVSFVWLSNMVHGASWFCHRINFLCNLLV